MSDNEHNEIPPEWSHWVDVRDTSDFPKTLEIAPDDAARARLVTRLNILALDDCQVRVKLSTSAGHMIHVEGEIEAQLRQNCVVTMEPVNSQLQESFEAWYADPEQVVSLAKARHDLKIKKGYGEMPVLDEKDDPEEVVDGRIDLGELVAQYLSLFIDPYPHAQGAELPEDNSLHKVAYEDNPITKNPFAALKDWKDNLK